MRLRTFESFWLLKNGLLHSYPSLQTKIQAEIVVIGGGISGALVSHALVEKGYDVVLLDKRDIGAGSTSATTSMLQYEIDVPLYELCDVMGEEGAVECYQAGIQAIKDLAELIAALKFDCGFETKQSIYVAHNKKASKWLVKEYAIRDKHNLGVSWLSGQAILDEYGLKTEGGILSETAGSVDAYKLAHDLINYNVGRGMRVYDQTKIDQYDFEHPEVVTLTTESNATIHCKQVIFCTGFETTNLLKEKIAKLFYTYASVSEQQIVLNTNLHRVLVWDTNEPYNYIRSTDDGRLLIGGEDAGTGNSLFQQRIKERKADRLKKNLEKLIPGINFIEDYSWGGIFGSTHDGLPYIGKSPEYEKALFVAGFGGNGITFSVQAMKIIPDLLEGRENKLAHYYRFGRK